MAEPGLRVVHVKRTHNFGLDDTCEKASTSECRPVYISPHHDPFVDARSQLGKRIRRQLPEKWPYVRRTDKSPKSPLLSEAQLWIKFVTFQATDQPSRERSPCKVLNSFCCSRRSQFFREERFQTRQHDEIVPQDFPMHRPCLGQLGLPAGPVTVGRACVSTRALRYPIGEAAPRPNNVVRPTSTRHTSRSSRLDAAAITASSEGAAKAGKVARLLAEASGHFAAYANEIAPGSASTNSQAAEAAPSGEQLVREADRAEDGFGRLARGSLPRQSQPEIPGRS
jgi:hypothetical protein